MPKTIAGKLLQLIVVTFAPLFKRRLFSLFKSLPAEIEHVAQVAIEIVDLVNKAVQEGTSLSEIVELTPTKIDDALLKWLRENLPKLLATFSPLETSTRKLPDYVRLGIASQILKDYAGVNKPSVVIEGVKEFG